MTPVISFVGRSDSGKTTFLEMLIQLLIKRSHRIGLIKHDAHGRVEFDRPGKDTYRHFQSGASPVVISGPGIIGLQRKYEGEAELDWLAHHYLSDVDLILTEGYKSGSKPKIEVFRREVSNKPLCEEADLLAIVTDTKLPLRVPQFPIDEPTPLADFLEQRYLRRIEYQRVRILVDGKAVPCNDFVQDFIAGGILGMLSTLHGVKNPGSVSVEITPGE